VGPGDSPPEFAVRPAEEADAASIALLCAQLGYPAREAEVLGRLRLIRREADHSVLVAQSPGGRVVGWIHVFGARTVEYEPRAEIGGLVVEESVRGRGAGERLVRETERWAREKGFGSITVRSNVVRERAHRFYEKLGYVTVKSQRVFRKSLGNSPFPSPGPASLGGTR
jgi:GNAT superfamily N-acetyltransferase